MPLNEDVGPEAGEGRRRRSMITSWAGKCPKTGHFPAETVIMNQQPLALEPLTKSVSHVVMIDLLS